MNINDFDQETRLKVAKYQKDYYLTHGKVCTTERAVNDIMLGKSVNNNFNKVQDSDIES